MVDVEPAVSAGPAEFAASALGRSLTLLVHGPSKTGKSTLGISTPAPRLLLDVEGGARFLPIRPVKWDPMHPPPDPDRTWDTAVVPTRDWGTVETVYQWLVTGEHGFRSLTVDSVSEAQQRHIESVGHRRQMTQTQWGETFRAVTGLIRDLRDLTMHPSHPLECVVMTAMTKQVDNVWSPWMQGQAAAILPYLLDVCAYMWIDQTINELTGEVIEKRKLLTRRTSNFEAGERVAGRIPRILELREMASGEVMSADDGAVSKMVRLIFGPRPAPLTSVPPPTPPAADLTSESDPESPHDEETS